MATRKKAGTTQKASNDTVQRSRKTGNKSSKTRADGKGKSSSGNGKVPHGDKPKETPALKWPDTLSDKGAKLGTRVLDFCAVSPVHALQHCATAPREILLEAVYFTMAEQCRQRAGLDWLTKLSAPQLACILVSCAHNSNIGYESGHTDAQEGRNYLRNVKMRMAGALRRVQENRQTDG